MIASGIVQKLNAQMNQEFYTSNLGNGANLLI
ncbi:ferritin-like protein [Enterobacter hormaechei]|nr:ferritin-like protein [Enterobacter hormaechei]